MAGLRIDDYSDEVNITINEKEWTYYESSGILYCPSGKSIVLFIGAGGIVPSSILIDNLEIVRITGSTIPTDVKNQWVREIKDVQLFQNYPNPFNPVTKIKYAVPNNPVIWDNGISWRVQLKIFDILGNEIAVLVDKEQQPGIYEVQFDGSRLTSGIYF